uniref:RNA-binding protein 5 n=1 Tax=Lygus hesperus TaxID=30085 RepID=A0A0A9Z1F7_LYGHE
MQEHSAPPPAPMITPPVASPVNTGNRYSLTAGAADIGFAVLERKDHLSTLGNYYEARNETHRNESHRHEIPPAVVPPSIDSDEEDETNEDKNHTDWDRLICLLCKRQLGSREALMKHQQMSDLHKQNLAAWYRSRGLDPDDAQNRQNQYRDRASERRQKYGLPDTPKPSRLKENYIKARETAYEQPTTKGIGSDNLGNKLLQKMGWQEGMGLGKSNQGRTSIIEASRRTATAGLGSRAAGVTPGPGETYKDCVKKMMAVRYAQLEDQS